MATIQNVPNTVSPKVAPPTSSQTTESTAATTAVPKGFLGSDSKVQEFNATSAIATLAATVVTYALEQSPPLTGKSATQAVDKLKVEVAQITSDQIDALYNMLFTFLMEMFNNIRKNSMQNRLAESQNQVDAMLASASKLLKSAEESKTAGRWSAIAGIVAGVVSTATASWGLKSVWGNKSMATEFTSNNQQLTAKTQTLAPPKSAEPTIQDAINLRNAPKTKLEIKDLENTQAGLKLKIDESNTRGQAFTQGGTALGGLGNSIGAAGSNEVKYEADLKTAQAKQDDAQAQKSAAAMDEANNLMQTAMQKFAEVLQNMRDKTSNDNNRIQSGIKNLA